VGQVQEPNQAAVKPAHLTRRTRLVTSAVILHYQRMDQRSRPTHCCKLQLQPPNQPVLCEFHPLMFCTPLLLLRGSYPIRLKIQALSSLVGAWILVRVVKHALAACGLSLPLSVSRVSPSPLLHCHPYNSFVQVRPVASGAPHLSSNCVRAWSAESKRGGHQCGSSRT